MHSVLSPYIPYLQSRIKSDRNGLSASISLYYDYYYYRVVRSIALVVDGEKERGLKKHIPQIV